MADRWWQTEESQDRVRREMAVYFKRRWSTRTWDGRQAVQCCREQFFHMSIMSTPDSTSLSAFAAGVPPPPLPTSNLF